LIVHSKVLEFDGLKTRHNPTLSGNAGLFLSYE